MTFTTNLFLNGLLPGFVLLFYIYHRKSNARYCLLGVANLIFYIWGGIEGFLLLAAMCFLTWFFSKICIKNKSKVLFGFGCLVLLTPLFLVKYSRFVLSSINTLCDMNFKITGLVVPIGLSFFSFEAISCLSDVYRGKESKPLSIWEVFLYLSFFPTVVSGPIVRIDNFRAGLTASLTVDKFNEGVQRFVIGLSKKILLADKISVLADYYFNGVAAGNIYSTLGFWIGSFAYTMQLYFDFSGYSDMAIGIAEILGFSLPDNFNKPYQAKSIQDFWRRWHISLSSWFRDYVYIPLGGNRCSSALKHVRNIFVVWLLTGLWHGADWTFIIWGIGYFILLIIEKYVPIMKQIGKKWYGHIYTMFFVNLLWVPFRADNVSVAIKYILGMFGMNSTKYVIEEKALRFLPLLTICIFLCLPWNVFCGKFNETKWYKNLKTVVFVILTVISLCAVVNASYTPYIYGNF